MAAEPVKITLFDLDHADVQDISRELATQSPGLTPEAVPGSRYGEPTMLVLAVAFAIPTIQALAAWALKNRRKQRIELRAKVLYSDGSEVDRSAIISFSESEAPDAQVIKQLIDGLGLQGLPEGDGGANP
ncbi:hypothetical protein OG203_44825 [Nocardia sp. NBC_01499]|uniref:hypothetical protein n=1 Tax=Nocardia sp. NBC_01499 TaxID=2903597 RepID=UPI00386A31B9